MVRRSIYVGDLVFKPNIDLMFPAGQLPTGRRVMEMMFALNDPKASGQAVRTVEESAHVVTQLLMEHWEWCNIYTITVKSIKKKVLSLYNDYKTIRDYKKDRLKSEAYRKRMDEFKYNVDHLFDIKVQDPIRRKSLEEMYSIKMTEDEDLFYEDQKENVEDQRKRYSSGYVDRRWLKTMDRIKKREESIKKKEQREKEEKKKEEELEQHLKDIEADEDQIDDKEQSDYVVPASEPPARGRKRRYIADEGGLNSHLPEKYRKIRDGQPHRKTPKQSPKPTQIQRETH